MALFLHGAHTKKPPLKGEVPAKRAEGFRPPYRKVAAALSAAVTTTKFIGNAPTSQAEPSKQKRLNSNANRSSGEGVWGRGASLREAASPPASSTISRKQVAAALSPAVATTKPIRNASTSQAEPSKRKRPNSNANCSSGEGVWGRGASLREAASPPESPTFRLSGREREGGGLSSERPPPSHYS